MKRLNCLIIIFNGALVVYLLYFAIKNNRLTLYFEIILLLTYTCILIIHFNNKSPNIFIDIRVYLLISYNIYALYTPIVYLIYNKTGYIKLAWNLNTYSYDNILKGVLISILFFIGFSIPFLINNKAKSYREIEIKKSSKQVTTYNKNLRFYFWLILFLISFIWYIYPYFHMGFKEALNYGRWERYVLFYKIIKEAGLIGRIATLSLSPCLMILSIFIMFREVFNKRKNSKERIIFIVVFLFITLFLLFVDGRRRELMYMIIMCFSYYMFCMYKRIKRTQLRKYLLYLIITAVLFITYQYYREYFNLANKEGISYALEFKEKESQSLSKESKLYSNEFGMVYENILLTIKFKPKPLYGRTYFESMLSPIPILNKIIFYNGDRTTSLLSWLSRLYPEIFLRGGGFGFFPAAEAYLNFGYGGCLVIGIILGMLFNLIYLYIYNPKYILFYSIILPQGLNFSRTPFQGVTEEIFWYMLYYFLYNTILKVIVNDRNRVIIRNNITNPIKDNYNLYDN